MFQRERLFFTSKNLSFFPQRKRFPASAPCSLGLSFWVCLVSLFLFLFLSLSVSFSMSSILSSQGVVLATAMAVSGTVILLAFRRQKTHFPIGQISQDPQRVPRSCISSGGRKKKKKKKVHFAEDVVDPSGDSEEFRRRHSLSSDFSSSSPSSPSPSSSSNKLRQNRNGKIRGMPANRAALYNGILRDRGVHRLAFAY